MQIRPIQPASPAAGVNAGDHQISVGRIKNYIANIHINNDGSVVRIHADLSEGRICRSYVIRTINPPIRQRAGWSICPDSADSARGGDINLSRKKLVNGTFGDGAPRENVPVRRTLIRIQRSGYYRRPAARVIYPVNSNSEKAVNAEISLARSDINRFGLPGINRNRSDCQTQRVV